MDYDPTLRIDFSMSLYISCKTGLKCARCRFAGKYVRTPAKWCIKTSRPFPKWDKSFNESYDLT